MACNSQACNSQAWNSQAWDSQACNSQACNSQACNSQACNSQACNSQACNRQACNSKACNIQACNSEACNSQASNSMDGCRSKLVTVLSGVPQGSVLGPLLFLLYTSELFSILENKLIGYADDHIAVVPSPGVKVAVAESWSMTLAGLVSGVTFEGWNWMRVRPRLW